MDKVCGGTQTNGLRNKEIDNDLQDITQRGDIDCMCQKKKKKKKEKEACIENCFDLTIHRLEKYTKSVKKAEFQYSETVISTEIIWGQPENSRNLENKNRKIKLHGYFKGQTEETAYKITWTWLRRGNLKKKCYLF